MSKNELPRRLRYCIEKGAYKKQIIERNIGNQLGFDSN